MRRWLRFSLWHVLALTLVVALMLALVLNPILARRRVIRRIEQLGARVSTDPMVPGTQLETIRYWLERRCFGSQPVAIRTLDARGCSVTDDDLKWIARLEKLRELDLSFTLVTDAGVPELAALSRLRFLSLSGTGVSGRHMTMFERMPMLCDVQMLGTQASESDAQNSDQRKRGLAIYCSNYAHNASLPDLAKVFANGAQLRYERNYFDYSGSDDDASLHADIDAGTKNIADVVDILKTLPIDSLSIVDRDFSAEEAHTLGELEVQTLFLANPGFADFAWLREIHGLRRLFFYNLVNEDEFAQVLHELTDLRELHVVSERLIRDIKSLDGLTALSFNRTTDKCIDWITKLPKLRYLHLVSPDLSVASYHRLADELPLEKLRLSDCRLSERALAELGNMRSLCKLDLDSSVTIDVEGLKHLHQLAQLKNLTIWGVTAGDDDEALVRLQALATALPQCEISTDLPVAAPRTANVER